MPSIPLFGNIGRLAEQKGVEIMLGALEEMLSAKMQFVAIGSGAPAFQRAYQDLARRYPSQVAVRIGFDEGLSHRIEAGCDFFLMPSRFEPCGLNQMYGLRYGTIPIVRTTGGLDDTVIDVREDAGKANGIKFIEYSATALAKGIRKALALYRRAGVAASFPPERHGRRLFLGPNRRGVCQSIPEGPRPCGQQPGLSRRADYRQRMAPALFGAEVGRGIILNITNIVRLLLEQERGMLTLSLAAILSPSLAR